jgi:hypothetical protein
MKKLYAKFLTYSRGKQIAVAVCLVHFFAIFCLVAHHLTTIRWKTPRPMVVKTILEQPPRSIAHAPKATPTPKPQKVSAPVTPKPAKKPSPGLQPKPTNPVAKKSLPVPKSSLDPNPYKEIAESLETFSSEAKSNRPSLLIPSKVQPKAQITTESNLDPTYGEFLIAYLQTSLDLPEYGEVRTKLEIDRFGKLIDCEIVEAKSLKNAEFLKNQLPQLTFPCLNDFGIIDPTQTFNVTFRNVENH